MQVLERAVYGMLPKNKLRKRRMFRLRIFPDADHTLGEFLDSDNPTPLFRCSKPRFANATSMIYQIRNHSRPCIHCLQHPRRHIIRVQSAPHPVNAPVNHQPSTVFHTNALRDKFTMAPDDEAEHDFEYYWNLKPDTK